MNLNCEPVRLRQVRGRARSSGRSLRSLLHGRGAFLPYVYSLGDSGLSQLFLVRRPIVTGSHQRFGIRRI